MKFMSSDIFFVPPALGWLRGSSWPETRTPTPHQQRSGEDKKKESFVFWQNNIEKSISHVF